MHQVLREIFFFKRHEPGTASLVQLALQIKGVSTYGLATQF